MFAVQCIHVLSGRACCLCCGCTCCPYNFPPARKGVLKRILRAVWVTNLQKDSPHESLSELHNHILVSKGHLQIHLGETGLSVTTRVLHHRCTILLSTALSVLHQCSLTLRVVTSRQAPLLELCAKMVFLACRSLGQNTRLLSNC